MPLDYSLIKNWQFAPIGQTYSVYDCIRYALGVGFGYDPTDEKQLRYVFEKNQLVPPTMACILGHPGPWMFDKKAGLDWVKIVHGEHDLRLFKPLVPSGEVYSENKVLTVVDKGKGKGALIVTKRDLYDRSSGELLASQWQNAFARGDGGFGSGDPPPEPLPSIPEGKPDAVCDLPTYPNQALLYRLCSDLNPLHADPVIAARAGFPRPILHGLATYGLGCHAVLRTFCDYDQSLLKRYAVRFTAPVFPGETVQTEMWRRGSVVHFRSSIVERNVVVLDHGIAELH
jgi:acyl dehydratase